MPQTESAVHVPCSSAGNCAGMDGQREIFQQIYGNLGYGILPLWKIVCKKPQCLRNGQRHDSFPNAWFPFINYADHNEHLHLPPTSPASLWQNMFD